LKTTCEMGYVATSDWTASPKVAAETVTARAQRTTAKAAETKDTRIDLDSRVSGREMVSDLSQVSRRS